MRPRRIDAIQESAKLSAERWSTARLDDSFWPSQYWRLPPLSTDALKRLTRPRLARALTNRTAKLATTPARSATRSTTRTSPPSAIWRHRPGYSRFRSPRETLRRISGENRSTKRAKDVRLCLYVCALLEGGAHTARWLDCSVCALLLLFEISGAFATCGDVSLSQRQKAFKFPAFYPLLTVWEARARMLH
jgi:hypothetical protein